MDIALYALVGLGLGLVMMFPLRRMARTLGLIDEPGGRKSHGEAVPLVGGVAIFFALCGSIIFMPTAPDERGWFIVACAIMVGMGLLDDRYQLRAMLRLAVQVVVALMMIYGAGLAIRSIGSPFFVGEIRTGMLAVPFTLLVALTVINAYNMTDGMDGLAGGVSLVSLLPMLSLVLLAGRWPEARLLAALVGAILAFLLFNYPGSWVRRRRTFMGDAGSTFLGLVIVWMGISISQGPDRLLSPVAGLWFIATPVHDLITSALRRWRKGQAFWVPDLGHAHHILIKAGFSVRQTLLSMLAVAFVYGLVGLSGPLLGVPDGVLFMLWILAGLGHLWIIQHAWVFSKVLEILRTEL